MCKRLHVCVCVSRLSTCVCDTFCALSKRLKNNYTFDINGACSWRRQQEQQIKQPQQKQQLQKQPQQQQKIQQQKHNNNKKRSPNISVFM